MAFHVVCRTLVQSFPRFVLMMAVGAAVITLPVTAATSAGIFASVSPERVLSDPISGQDGVQNARSGEGDQEIHRGARPAMTNATTATTMPAET